MSDKSSSSSSGIGFFGLLAIVFITLKLLDKIDWSWWWVLAPLWGPVALAVAIFVAYMAVLISKDWWGAARRRQRQLDRERRDAVFMNKKR